VTTTQKIIRVVATALLLAWCVTASAATKEESLQEAQQLHDEARKLYAQAHYQEAIPLSKKALEIREEVLGPDHVDTATSLDNLAQLYHVTGLYSQAEPLYRRAIQIFEKTVGPEAPETALSLNNLGVLVQLTGRNAEAESLFRRALAIREKVLGPEHPDTAKSIGTLAGVYKTMGAYTEAERLYKRAVEIVSKARGPEHRETAVAIYNLANIYADTGAYAEAEPLYLRALAIKEKTVGLEHPSTALSINSLAEIYHVTGAYTQAVQLHLRALAIREKVLGAEHTDTATSLNNLANIYCDTGDYVKAELFYQRALAIWEKALGPEHENTGIALSNLAQLYVETGSYARAEPLLRRALAIWTKVLGPEHPYTAESLNNLADFYHATSAYAQAEALYKQSLAIYEKSLGTGHPTTATSLNNLAALHWARGEPLQALPLLQRAQTNQQLSSERFLLSGSESRKKAYLQALANDTFKYVSFSVAMPNREGIALGLSAVLQYKGRVLDAMSDSVARLRQSVKPEDREVIEELAQLASQLSTSIYQGPGDLSADEYRKHLADLVGQQEKLEVELAKRSSEFRRQVTHVTLASVRQAIPANAVLVEWLRYSPFDPKSVGSQARQPNPRYVAYILKHDGRPAVIDMGDAHEIELLVREFRIGVIDSKRSDFKSSARALFEKLFTPLRGYLKDSERLLVSPDGALNLLPMEALLNEQGDYLAKRFEITYLTSGRDLLRFAPSSSSPGSAVVVADPDFGTSATLVAQSSTAPTTQRSADVDRGGLIFRPLSNTAIEAETLKELLNLNRSNLFLRDQATEANLKLLHGPRILHLASHGFFLSDQELSAEIKKRSTLEQKMAPVGENPLLRSGIALAGANARRSGASDDGILTAMEVAQLDLHGTELVVLSACDSGLGDVQNGEGVYGLRRALVLAGAQTQVTSLWKVSDEATRTLMVDFYQRLLKGEGRSAALRHAQLAMLENPELAHPYYWASFVPIGNWNPLTPAHLTSSQ